MRNPLTRMGLTLRRPVVPGAAPGSLVADPESPPPRIRLIGFDSEDMVEEEVTDPTKLPDSLKRWVVCWVNVDGLGDVEVLREIGSAFGLSKLELEDVLNVGQRPKIEEHSDHVFIVAQMVSLADEVVIEQVSMFLGQGWVLSFQERDGDGFEPVRKRLRDNRGRIRSSGADYLAYALSDSVVDGFFPVLESLADRLDSLEEEIEERPDRDVLARVHQVRKEMLGLRRSIWPQIEVLRHLSKETAPFVEDDTRIFVRDVLDHAVQIVELLDTYREVAEGLMSYYQSVVSNRLNDVMRVLTMVATIFVPLSFMAGLYGMNFDPSSPWNMPELRWYWGYPFVLSLMAAVTLVLLLFFRRKGWLNLD